MENATNNTKNLVQRVTEYLQSPALHENDIIIVAVSGGVDSMVLLHLVQQIQQTMPFQLHAVHLDHQLRGEESEKDAQFVAETCQQLHIPLHMESIDVAAWCHDNKCSIETGARDCRYRFFARIKQKTNARFIATAHNANDNAETILDRMMRGSGLRGLGGIPGKRSYYIRPILGTTRHEIETFAIENSIHFRNDSSNQDIQYKRNRIRHRLLPFLEQEFNPQIISVLNRTGAIMRQANELVIQEAQLAFSQCVREEKSYKIVLDISVFLTYLLVLQVEMIRTALEKLGETNGFPGYEQFINLESFMRKKQSGSAFQLTQRIEMLFSGNELVIWQRPDVPQAEVLVSTHGSFKLWGMYILEIKKAVKPLKLDNKDRNVEWIDADKFKHPLCIRPFRPGDRFVPVNMKGTKKISDFFIDEKVPVYMREFIPVLESNGNIVWVGGYRLDDRFKITDKTKNYLKLELRTV